LRPSGKLRVREGSKTWARVEMEREMGPAKVKCDSRDVRRV
jgi:hypothetical protein